MKTHVIFIALILNLFGSSFGGHSAERNQYQRFGPRNYPTGGYSAPLGTLNNLQIQPNNSVLNTIDNTFLRGVFGNASGIFFNGTTFG